MSIIDEFSQSFHIPQKSLPVFRQAFVHRSFLNESKTYQSSNERLEFLGDSILSYLVSEYLFITFPQMPEGELTNIRSSLVKTATLANIAKQLNLGDKLLLSKGEEDGGGRTNTSILADTFEAFLGSLYLISGATVVKELLTLYLYPKLTEILKTQSYKDPKSTFQEIVQEDAKISPVYKVLNEQGPDHMKTFEIGVFVAELLWGKGSGKNKQEAEQAAASTALEKWKKK